MNCTYAYEVHTYMFMINSEVDYYELRKDCYDIFKIFIISFFSCCSYFIFIQHDLRNTHTLRSIHSFRFKSFSSSEFPNHSTAVPSSNVHEVKKSVSYQLIYYLTFRVFLKFFFSLFDFCISDFTFHSWYFQPQLFFPRGKRSTIYLARFLCFFSLSFSLFQKQKQKQKNS